MLQVSREIYKSFGECVKFSDENAEMLVTLDVGPRIISYRLNGMENIMCEDEDGKSTMSGGKFAEVFGDRQWRIYGGHRLWLAPEDDPRSYYPDNEKVELVQRGDRFILTPPPQIENGLQFEIELDFINGVDKAEVLHRITNIADQPKKLSVWAMSVLDAGALSLIPQSSKETGLLSNRNLSLWQYTDIYDSRLLIGNKYITVQQDCNCKSNLKVGLNNEDGWIAATAKGQLFVKRFVYDETAEYPDNHCNCECFTNFFMTEIESIGILSTLEKGQSTEHLEKWELTPCGEVFDGRNEASATEFAEKYIV